MPQLWHLGVVRHPGTAPIRAAQHEPLRPRQAGQEGRRADERRRRRRRDRRLRQIGHLRQGPRLSGGDASELHGAHGYLIDQFFWEGTNRRGDKYGGSLEARSNFAADIARAVRAAVGPDFPILLRFSQWKQQDFAARLRTRRPNSKPSSSP
ncbi:MAG: hypothetical protein WDM81_04250 [Rhizomicrobium sp.]